MTQQLRKKPIILIDGNFFAHRSYHRFKNAQNSNGFKTGAIYGFFRSLVKVKRDFLEYEVIVVFDNGLNSDCQKHPTYKQSRRGGHTKEFGAQIDAIKKILRYLGVTTVEVKNREADEIIHMIINHQPCLWYEEKDYVDEFVIISNDKDFYQLLSRSPKVRILDSKKGMLDYDKFIHDYQITPNQYSIVKAIMGDDSDELPGIRGMGEKKSLDLVKQATEMRTFRRRAPKDDITPEIVKELMEITKPSALSEIEKVYINHHIISFEKGASNIFSDWEYDNVRNQILADREIKSDKVRKHFESLEFNSFLKDFDSFLANF